MIDRCISLCVLTYICSRHHARQCVLSLCAGLKAKALKPKPDWDALTQQASRPFAEIVKRMVQINPHQRAGVRDALAALRHWNSIAPPSGTCN